MAARDPIVTPEGWLHRGDAFVRGDNRQLAVFGGIPGERARVRLVGSRGNQDQAKWVAAAGRPHPDRVEPACDRFVPCGRCPLMHLTPEAQDSVRVALYDEAMAASRLAVRVDRVVHAGTDDALHVVELTTGYSDQKRARLGVQGQDGRAVVPIPECLVVTPSIRAVMREVSHHMRALEIWPFDGRKGTLRAVSVRESPLDGQVLLLLVAARPNPVMGELATRIVTAHPPVSGVVMHLNDAPTGLVTRDGEGDLGISVLYGLTHLTLPIGDLRLKSCPSDPYPGHPAMRARLVEDVVSRLGVAEGDAVFEIGADEGALTMAAAKVSGWALGLVEGEGVARRARENASANGVKAEFLAEQWGDAMDLARPRVEGRRPLVVASAGTRGLTPARIAEVLALAPRRVALRCANPRSLAQNMAAFVDAGFRVRDLVLYDEAPYTPFSEGVAVLESTDPTPPERRAPRRKTVRG